MGAHVQRATTRKLPHGKYRGEIVIRQGTGQKSFRKSFTGSRRSEVQAWADELERELRTPRGVERHQERASRISPTVGDLIRRYIEENDKLYGPTKADYLARLQTLEFSNRLAEDLTSSDWIDFARSLKVSRHKSTVAGYFGTLAEIMRRARRGWNVPVDIGAIEDARLMANDLGYTGKSDRRERRPTLEELDALMDFSITYSENDARTVPLHFVIAFAIFSARREADICKLRKDDVSGATVYVRDMKSPAGSRGNHRRLWILQQALQVARAHLRIIREESDRVFRIIQIQLAAVLLRLSRLAVLVICIFMICGTRLCPG